MVMDYWVFMIENWVDFNKEYEYCIEFKVEVCFLKMSKYLYCIFYVMKNIYNILFRVFNFVNVLKVVGFFLVYYLQFGKDLVIIFLEWVFKYCGVKDEIFDFVKNIKFFFDIVGCSGQIVNKVLDFECMKRI